MSSAKKLFATLLALGSTGAWMFMNSGNRETKGGGNFSLNLGVFMNPQGADTKKKKIQKAKVEEPPRQPVEPKGQNEVLDTEPPNKAPEVPKEIQGSQEGLKEPGGDQELKKNLEDPEDKASLQNNLKISEEIVDPQENLKGPQEVQDPKNLGRSDNGEEPPGLVIEENVIPDPKEEISEAGLDCGKAEGETICTILVGGINVDKGDGKKEGYVLSGTDNGKIKFRISEETDTYSNGFRFTIFEKPITLKSKTNPSQTITLEKYEDYGLVKDGDKVYLTRKLTAEQGMIKTLGLPDKCVLPTTVSTDVFDYWSPKTTCQILKNQIQSINFDGKKEGQTVSGGSSWLYIQKVGDETTYNKGGYKFFLHSDEDLNLPGGVKLAKKVWWDFRLKDPDADDLVLEKVWKNEDELLNKIGLSCANGTCSVNNNSLKIKIDNKTSTEKGRKKSGEGILYLEKNTSRYYEGLKFSVWGGEIKIEDSTSGSTLEMKETEEYHITKKDSNTPIFYLTRKQGVESAITNFLGMSNCAPNPTKGSAPRRCTAPNHYLWRQFKFHDGDGEQRIKSNNSKLSVVITISQDPKLPFGYRYNLKPSEDLQIGKIFLPKSGVDFQIMRDVKNKKLYLEKVK